jgi:hypothetical protein
LVALTVGIGALATSCQTRSQAKVLSAGTTSIALLGGYLEYKARPEVTPPLIAITAGTVAIISAISMFFLDEHPRILFDDRPPWKPAPRHGTSELLAAIRRAPCFGRCPAYSVAIYRDGEVEYIGRSDVATLGRSVGRLDSAQISALEHAFDEASFRTLEDSYIEENCTDLPTVHIWYRPLDAQTKRVTHYVGDRSAPKSLFALEDAVDSAVNIEQWIGARKQHPGAAATVCR